MSRKKDKNVVQFETSLAFPTHGEIEESLQRRVRLWEDPDRKVRYPLAVLDFLSEVEWLCRGAPGRAFQRRRICR
jgi:hypothetical protein